MKPEAILFHSARFRELADVYRRALDLPGSTPMGESHVGRPSTTPYLGVDDDPYGAVSVWFRDDDVDAAIARLVSLGATPLTSPGAVESPGEIVVRARHPAGNVVGLLACA